MSLAPQYQLTSFFTVALLVFAGLPGCASVSSTQQSSAAKKVFIAQTPGKPIIGTHRGLAIARNLVGTPYRYGGASPRGFDCSGLVYYAYRKAGMQIPRTTTEQYRKTKRVSVSRLQPGDLLFFAISQNKSSHVGIYAGNDRFIHAPSSGKLVSYASLDNPYWQKRLIGAGRL